jgi:hypothetical protein
MKKVGPRGKLASEARGRITYDPLAMYYGNRKGAEKGEGNPKLVPHRSV